MRATDATTAQKMRYGDNGGRRIGDDRRLYSYNGHLPERRNEEDRRSGPDRRTSLRSA